MSKTDESKIKITDIEAFKKLPKEERRKIREKRREEAGIPTKMTKYLYFVLIFAGIVNFFDTWCTITITYAMGSVSREIVLNLETIIQKFTNPDLFAYFDIGGSPVTMGIILSIAGIGVVASVSFKYLIDKYGRRPLTLWTAIAFITITVLTSFTPPHREGLIIFLILRILANYFLSADIVMVIMAEEAPDRLRGRLVGAVGAIGAVGGFFCGILQAGGASWQNLFFLTSLGYFFIIPLFFFLKETKRFNAMKKYEEYRKKKGLKPKTNWKAPLKREFIRPMTLGCITGFLGTLINFAQVSFFGVYFAQEQNMSPTLVGLLSLPLMIAAGLGYFTAGYYMDRWGRLPCIVIFGSMALIGGALCAYPTLFVAGAIPNTFLMLLVVIGYMSTFYGGAIMGVAVALIPLEMFPTHIRSTAMGWIGAISRAGSILAPILMMYGAEKLGGLGLTYHFMFRMMGLVLSTIIFTALLLGTETKGRQLEEVVATETYGKMKRPDKKTYREPYILYSVGLVIFFFCFFIYGLAAGGEAVNVLYMILFYTVSSAVCLVIVAYVRKIISE